MIGRGLDGARRHRHGEGGTGSAAGSDSERLARHAGQDLEWVQPRWWRCGWQLRAGEDTLLTLEPAGWWRTSLAAELDGERVEFGCSLWRETAVRKRDGAEIGRLHRTGFRLDEDSERLGMSRWWGTGRLEYADRERAWLKRAPWAARWTLLDDRGRELAAFARRHVGLAARGEMRLAPRAAERPALALLATFAWWVITRELARQSYAHGAH